MSNPYLNPDPLFGPEAPKPPKIKKSMGKVAISLISLGVAIVVALIFTVVFVNVTHSSSTNASSDDWQPCVGDDLAWWNESYSSYGYSCEEWQKLQEDWYSTSTGTTYLLDDVNFQAPLSATPKLTDYEHLDWGYIGDAGDSSDEESTEWKSLYDGLNLAPVVAIAQDPNGFVSRSNTYSSIITMDYIKKDNSCELSYGWGVLSKSGVNKFGSTDKEVTVNLMHAVIPLTEEKDFTLQKVYSYSHYDDPVINDPSVELAEWVYTDATTNKVIHYSLRAFANNGYYMYQINNCDVTNESINEQAQMSLMFEPSFPVFPSELQQP